MRTQLSLTLPYTGQSSKPDNQRVGSTQLGRAGVKA